MFDFRHATGSLLVEGDRVPIEWFVPERVGPHPAVVLGVEAVGISTFVRDVGRRLASAGRVVAIPDYYRGAGPDDPDDYTDVDGMMAAIAGLDFRRATWDLLAAVDAVRARDDVAGDDVAIWGYCTGGTVALLAACLDRHLACSVQFYPSQLTFAELDAAHPVHAIDMLWNLRTASLLLYGLDDHLLPLDLREELRTRLDEWGGRHQLRLYKGAGHVFASEGFGRHHPEADQDSWARAVAWLDRHSPVAGVGV